MSFDWKEHRLIVIGAALIGAGLYLILTLAEQQGSHSLLVWNALAVLFSGGLFFVYGFAKLIIGMIAAMVRYEPQTEVERFERRLTVDYSLGTYLLMAAVILPFLVLLAAGKMPFWLGPSHVEMIRIGGNYGRATAQGETWRLFTSVFLHYGVIHLLLNLLALRHWGRSVEFYLGRANLFFIFVLSGVFGAACNAAWYDEAVTAGASGAIFGLIGSLFAVTASNKKLQLGETPKRHLVSTLLFFVITFADHLLIALKLRSAGLAASLGGFSVGFAFAFIILNLRIFEVWARAVLSGAVCTTAVLGLVLARPNFPHLNRPVDMAQLEEQEEAERLAILGQRVRDCEKTFLSHLHSLGPGGQVPAEQLLALAAKWKPDAMELRSELGSLRLSDQRLKDIRGRYEIAIGSVWSALLAIEEGRDWAAISPIIDKIAQSSRAAGRGIASSAGPSSVF